MSEPPWGERAVSARPAVASVGAAMGDPAMRLGFESRCIEPDDDRLLCLSLVPGVARKRSDQTARLDDRKVRHPVRIKLADLADSGSALDILIDGHRLVRVAVCNGLAAHRQQA